MMKGGRKEEGEAEEVKGEKEGGVLSAQHSKLTCSMYCQYLKYDASQGSDGRTNSLCNAWTKDVSEPPKTVHTCT